MGCRKSFYKDRGRFSVFCLFDPLFYHPFRGSGKAAELPYRNASIVDPLYEMRLFLFVQTLKFNDVIAPGNLLDNLLCLIIRNRLASGQNNEDRGPISFHKFLG